MSKDNANWERIHEIPVYDPAIMRKCQYIDNAIYVPSSESFYTPIFRFVKDDGSPNINIEIYVERISTQATERPATVRTSLMASAMRGSMNTHECAGYKITVPFEKPQMADFLQLSIDEDSYIWENPKFQEKAKAAIIELAELLTNRVKKPVLCSTKEYVLSSGEGVICTKKEGTLAGKFAGVVIEGTPYTMQGTKTTSYNMIVKIPKMVFNQAFFNLNDCDITYTDSANNIIVIADGSNVSRNQDGTAYINIRSCKIEGITSGDMRVPSESMEELLAKKLFIPQSKFENRLAMLGKHTENTSVEVVKIFNVKAAQRFESLAK